MSARTRHRAAESIGSAVFAIYALCLVVPGVLGGCGDGWGGLFVASAEQSAEQAQEPAAASAAPAAPAAPKPSAPAPTGPAAPAEPPGAAPAGAPAAPLGLLTHLGSLNESLRSPARLAVAADGTLLVSDPINKQIVRFDAAGTLLGTLAVPEGPIGLAIHPDGRYFLSRQADNQVAIYDSGFHFTGLLGEGVVTFVKPVDIAIAATTGRIYVADAGADKVYGFESDGSLSLTLGVRGSGPGEFKAPVAICVDEPADRLIVADQGNFRIQIFDTAGQWQNGFGYRMRYWADPAEPDEGWLPRPQAVAVDDAGHIYVADAWMGTVRLFAATGEEFGKVVEYGFGPGQLRTPSDLALDPSGTRLYVASTNGASVEIYQTPDWSGISEGLPADGMIPVLDDPLSPFGFDVAQWDGPHMLDTPIICGRCHGIPDAPGGQVDFLEGQTALCLSCHHAAGQASGTALYGLDAADPYGTNPLVPDGQGRSHAWGVPAVNAQADSVGPAPGGAMEAYLTADGKIKCTTCHNQHNNEAGSPYLRVSNDGDAMCKQCHAARNKGPGEGGTHPVGFAYPAGTGEFPDVSTPGMPPIKAGKVECTTCHGVHGADSGGANGGAGDGMLLRGPNDGTFCQVCHSEHSNHTPGGPWQPTCTDCHDLHDPDNTNLSLIAAVLRNQTLGVDKPVVFTARTGANSFDDGDPAANDGICQVCHTATNYHKQDGSGVSHNDGTDCTSCHPHSAGFMPTGGDCTSCHSAPQDNGDGVPPGGRRAVVGEFSLASHHVQGAPLENDDCLACHDMGQHQRGQVRLKNVDDPANPAAVVVLDGDPSVDATEAAKLEPFCLACHDSDAAGGQAPFSDGLMPPVVDATLWNDGSHNQGGAAGSMTCFGDGETFGCHSTGHGSAKQNLLAPADASQAPVAGDPLREEEGMCYTCHDANGPASTDLESQFASAYRHNVSSLDQQDGSRVECTQCHEPHTATATARLAGPDSGAVWTGTDRDFCLACHDGNPPAGVSFPADSAGTGYDKSAFMGSRHAAKTGAEGCRACHEEHGSPNLAMLKAQYITTDYNPYSTGDGDYAACWQCHDENATIEQDNAFKNLHRKHVKGERSPCFLCHDTHAPHDSGEAGLISFEAAIRNGYDIQYIDGRDASTSFWIDTNQNKGYCYIRCHNKDHKPKSYDRINTTTVNCSQCHSMH